MFITLQFPIFDYRFLQPDFKRAEKPNWPLAENRDRVRYIGQVFDRTKPYLGPYDDEKKYCTAKGIFNLCGTGKQHFFKLLHSSDSRSRILFRRFQSDGQCFSKFEIGFDDNFEFTDEAIVKDPGETTKVIFRHIEKYLLCPVMIKIGNKLDKFTPLVEAGHNLKQAYYWATSRKKRSFNPQEMKYRVENCEPAAFIHVDSQKLDLSVFNSQKVEIPELSENGIQLFYHFIPYTIDKRVYRLKAWIIGVPKDVTTNPLRSSDFHSYNIIIRYLRINLLRIHAETIILKKALEAIGNPGEEGGVKDQATRNRVYFYLHKKLLNLSKVKRYDQPQDKLIEKAFRLDTSYYGSESIEDRIEGLNTYIDWIKSLPETPDNDRVRKRAEESISDIQKELDSQVSVFISYNHADQEIATDIKAFLEKENIKVIIDSDSMIAGEDIDEFIRKSVKNSYVTLSIVSVNSLSSGWVGKESIKSIYLEDLSDNKKFIACYLDESFFADEFVLNSTKKINTEIDKIDELIAKQMKAGIGISILNDKRSRLISLRDNLEPIVRRLNSSLTVDIREQNRPNGLNRILTAIKSKKKG